MPLHPISCPSCSFQGKVPEAYLGKQIRCKKCGNLFEAALGPSVNLNDLLDETELDAPDAPIEDQLLDPSSTSTSDLAFQDGDMPLPEGVKVVPDGEGAHFHCGMCQVRYAVSADMAGKAIRCRVCSEWGKVRATARLNNSPRTSAVVRGLLVGTGVGSLLVVGLIVLAVLLSRKSDKASQNQVFKSSRPSPADVERERAQAHNPKQQEEDLQKQRSNLETELNDAKTADRLADLHFRLQQENARRERLLNEERALLERKQKDEATKSRREAHYDAKARGNRLIRGTDNKRVVTNGTSPRSKFMPPAAFGRAHVAE